MKDIRVNCPAAFSPSQASQSDVPRLPRKSLHGLTGMMRVRREWQIQRYTIWFFCACDLRSLPSIFQDWECDCCGGSQVPCLFAVVGFRCCVARVGAGGPHTQKRRAKKKNHSATRDRRWAFGIVVVGVAENIRFLWQSQSTKNQPYQNHIKIISKS